MNGLNIQEIANARIAELHESGSIQKQIEDGIDKTIKNAIDDAVSSYGFKREIQDKVETELSAVANTIGFDGYTKFLTEKLTDVIGKYVKGDMAKKIEKEFSSIYLDKRESINLSEIFEAYKSYLQSELDWEEQRSWGGIRLECEGKNYLEYKIGNPQSSSNRYGMDKYDTDKEFRFCLFGVNNEKKTATIGSVYLDNTSIDKELLRRHLTDFEMLILNLMYNGTTVIIDCDEDYDLYFDYEF